MTETTYQGLLDELKGCEPLPHKRTGTLVRTIDETRVLRFDMPVVPTHRRYYPKQAARELAWFLGGGVEGDAAPSFWSKFVEDDGRIPAAYGARWRKYHGFDQLTVALDRLSEDISFRRAWIDTWQPQVDLQYGRYKSHPCLVGFNLRVVRGNSLVMTCVKRSTDVIIGLPYDMMVQQMLHVAMVQYLNWKWACDFRTGPVEFVLMNPHCYEQHAETLEVRSEGGGYGGLVVPPRHLGQIMEDPNEYIEWIAKANWVVLRHEYAPKLEVVE